MFSPVQPGPQSSQPASQAKRQDTELQQLSQQQA